MKSHKTQIILFCSRRREKNNIEETPITFLYLAVTRGKNIVKKTRLKEKCYFFDCIRQLAENKRETARIFESRRSRKY